MSREYVTTICQDLPGAEVSDPWGGGHDAWKVGDKMFASIGVANDGVSVKTQSIEDAALLIDLGRATKAPYFHRSWVRIPWGSVDDDELRSRIELSYRIIRAGLTKKKQATLAPFPAKNT